MRPQPAAARSGGRRPTGASHARDHRQPAAPLLGHGEPTDGPSQDAAIQQGLPYSDVRYCKYGFKYKKATRIWHNLPSPHAACAARGTAATLSRMASTPRPPSAAPPTAAATKQPRDGVVPQVPCTGIFLEPSKSGKTVAIISAILEQYRTADGSSVFERIYIFSPSIEIDDGWKPVKEFIENEMGVNTEREQVYFDKWDEGALRTIIEQQKKITRTSKQLGLKKLYQVLAVIDDFADQPELHRRTGDGALDTLFIRGRHMQISTWVSSQKLRLISAAVRVNMQFMAAPEPAGAGGGAGGAQRPAPEAGAFGDVPGGDREPYSFWFIYYLKDKANMFYKRWEERFVVDGDAEPAEAQQPVNGRLPGGGQQAVGGRGPSSRASAASPTSTTRAWPRCRPGASAACPMSPRPVGSPERRSALGETSPGRTLNFRLTDVDGNEVNTRGTSVSFALDPEK